MHNRDLNAARKYHQRTKHSIQSVQTDRHYLDWDNRPRPFKIYSTLPPIPLPKEFPALKMSALEAIAAPREPTSGVRVPDLNALAQLFFLSNGVHRIWKRRGMEFYFRTASCTGALYHIELYLVCGDLPDLAAGVYQYGAHDHALRKLRDGDYRETLFRATAGDPEIAHAPAILISTDTFWRNAWKYQAREYRHTGWDNGVILANLLATAAALDLPAQVVQGFSDGDVNALPSLDTEKEVAISLVALGRAAGDSPTLPASRPEPLNLPTMPLSQYEIDYPLLREIHAASALSEGEVATWRGELPPRPTPSPAGRLFPLAPQPKNELARDSLDAVILRRGSTRTFAQAPITFAQLSTILVASSRGIPADFLQPSGASLNDWYLIVNDVEGLPSGSYYYHPKMQALEQLREGDFRDRAGALALGQELGRDAAVNIYYLADLESLLDHFGNRGYRAVQLEAGILGGKIYLAAYAQRLGATGLTFFDDDVTAFFSPHAAGKSVMFLMAVGHPLKRRQRDGA